MFLARVVKAETLAVCSQVWRLAKVVGHIVVLIILLVRLVRLKTAETTLRILAALLLRNDDDQRVGGSASRYSFQIVSETDPGCGAE